MRKGTLTPLFPATQKDVSRLRQSATDAVNDFSTSAVTHANKVGGQLVDLADHLQSEGRTNLERAKGKALRYVRSGHDLITEYPLATIGVVLAVGIFIGWSRSRRSVEPRNA